VTQEERLELLGQVAGMMASRGLAGLESKHVHAAVARPPLEWVALAWMAIVAGSIGAFVCLMCAIGFLIEPLVGAAATSGILAALLMSGSLLLGWSIHRRKQGPESAAAPEPAAQNGNENGIDQLPGLVAQLVKEFVESPETHGSQAMLTAVLAGFSAAISTRRS
jgi:hypothetical protein